MKPFHSWLAEQANSIVDNSTVVRDVQTFISPAASKPLTDLQKRMAVADMLVPKIACMNDVDSWAHVLCVATLGAERRLMLTLGAAICERYCELSGDDEHIEWALAIKAKIASGWTLEEGEEE